MREPVVEGERVFGFRKAVEIHRDLCRIIDVQIDGAPIRVAMFALLWKADQRVVELRIHERYPVGHAAKKGKAQMHEVVAPSADPADFAGSGRSAKDAIAAARTDVTHAALLPNAICVVLKAQTKRLSGGRPGRMF